LWKYICAELILGTEDTITIALSASVVARPEWGPDAAQLISNMLPDED
jgi:hypothetical protein